MLPGHSAPDLKPVRQLIEHNSLEPFVVGDDQFQVMQCVFQRHGARVIFQLLLPVVPRKVRKKKYEADEDALKMILDITEYYRKRDNFANARTVRNILEQVIMNQNLRTEESEKTDVQIIRSDVEDYISDENIDLSDLFDGKRRNGFA